MLIEYCWFSCLSKCGPNVHCEYVKPFRLYSVFPLNFRLFCSLVFDSILFNQTSVLSNLWVLRNCVAFIFKTSVIYSLKSYNNFINFENFTQNMKTTEKWMICSDIHDDVEALVRFADFAQARDVDRVMLLGDLNLRPYKKEHLDTLLGAVSGSVLDDKVRSSFVSDKRTHSRTILTEMKSIIDNSGIPYSVIPGNYDGNQDMESVFSNINLHKKTAMIRDAKVAGYGGAGANPPHIMLLNQLGEMDEFDNYELFNWLYQNSADVCLIHNPPRDHCDTMFNGANVGTEATTEYIRMHSPKLVLSGHIHESGPNAKNPRGVDGVSTYVNPETNAKTVILNPGNLGRFELINHQTLDAYMKFPGGTFMEASVEPNGVVTRVIAYTMEGPNRTVSEVRKLYERNF